MKQVRIKEYRSRADYDSDARRLIENGWQVVSVVYEEQRPGCLRLLLTGFLALLWRPKPRLLVTYQR